MVSKVIGFIALLFIFPSVEKDSRFDQIDKFFNGKWVVEKTTDSPLESMDFLGANCITFTFRGVPYPQNILKKYEYANLDSYPQNILLNVYTKDLVSEKKLNESSLHIEIVDKNTIKVKNKIGQVNTLKRKPRNANDIRFR
ncbi:hypothetical protein [Sphingobacterium sp. SGR-19]|uniref:hypothetical protein n=1 Tax=Sphingobacterium sp. SGR-19 TaxID=2710886 RepID=UPI0013E9DC02|nr:hypothetical protein [Sphingobacterium sp. SGR-19]NGM66228.1 hypothetical protein [Sphingobacterium sp. SGR-19]